MHVQCTYYILHLFNVARLATSERYSKSVTFKRGGDEGEIGYIYVIVYLCVCVKDYQVYV